MKDRRTGPNSVIILVEDEDALRRSITFTLLRIGYCVIPYGTVDEALQTVEASKVRNQKIKLVIADLRLPGKSGLDLVKTVRCMIPEVPIMVITGHGSKPIRGELAFIGVKDILDKPFSLDEFVTMVRKVLAGAPCHNDGNKIGDA